MSSFARLLVKRSLQITSSRSIINKSYPCIQISKLSTDKTKSTAAKTTDEVKNEDVIEDKNYMPYGFDYVNHGVDKWANSLMWVGGLVIGICWTGFYLAYLPDFRLQQWAQREAFLELARREKNGEPLVSKDFIPVDKINLPEDEELGSMSIVI